MPYRSSYLRKELPNEREGYIEAFFESFMAAVLPANLPVDINAHGSMLHSPGLNDAFGGHSGWNPAALPDAVVLYANALSLALALSNVSSSLFAAVRVAQLPAAQSPTVNPPAADLRMATSQLLYVGTRHGPLVVVYDGARSRRGPSSQALQSAPGVSSMLDMAHQAVLEQVEEQDAQLQGVDLSAREWPQLVPSHGSVRVLQELAGAAVDTFLRSGPRSRADQLLELSKVEVSPRLILIGGNKCVF